MTFRLLATIACVLLVRPPDRDVCDAHCDGCVEECAEPCEDACVGDCARRCANECRRRCHGCERFCREKLRIGDAIKWPRPRADAPRR